MQQRLPSLLDPPIAFAHRGARAVVRENTMEAFEVALRLGATGLESDVWLTADGVAVLDHDGVVGGRLRKKSISTVDRADLPAHIPTLEDLLRWDENAHHLSLDLKDPAAGTAVVDLAVRYRPDALDRFWICHPEISVLGDLRATDDRIRLVHSTRLERLTAGAERHAADLAAGSIDGINLHHTEWNGGLVALFHRFGRIAFGWDMQFEHVLRTALRMGLDGVFSDHVDVMMDAVRQEVGSMPT